MTRLALARALAAAGEGGSLDGVALDPEAAARLVATLERLHATSAAPAVNALSVRTLLALSWYVRPKLAKTRGKRATGGASPHR